MLIYLCTDLNSLEMAAQGPELPVALLPRTGKHITLPHTSELTHITYVCVDGIVMMQMDSRVPLGMSFHT